MYEIHLPNDKMSVFLSKNDILYHWILDRNPLYFCKIKQFIFVNDKSDKLLLFYKKKSLAEYGIRKKFRDALPYVIVITVRLTGALRWEIQC
jgi:hypothetical protein